MRALWDPGWYNLDQSVKVGRRDRFTFTPHGGDTLRFARDVSGRWDHREATVDAIDHARFGSVDEADTSEFGQYTFRFTDGRWVTVEAEEDPGRVNLASPDFPVEMCDRYWAFSSGWALIVTLSDVVPAGTAR